MRACTKQQKNLGLLTTFQLAIRLETVLKRHRSKAPKIYALSGIS